MQLPLAQRAQAIGALVGDHQRRVAAIVHRKTPANAPGKRGCTAIGEEAGSAQGMCAEWCTWVDTPGALWYHMVVSHAA